MIKNTSQQVIYSIGKSLYINITNKCNCRCVFCVRQYRDDMVGIDLKFRNGEPSCEEIIDIFKDEDLSPFEEFVFCGFGEPLMRFENMVKLAEFLKATYPDTELRLNTNGLGDLINNTSTLEVLSGILTSTSISLNAHNSEVYALYTRPAYDADVAYNAVLKYIKDSVKAGLKTTTTIVYGPRLNKIDSVECRKIAQNLGAEFRIRPY